MFKPFISSPLHLSITLIRTVAYLVRAGRKALSMDGNAKPVALLVTSVEMGELVQRRNE